jgi:hypothetical protein
MNLINRFPDISAEIREKARRRKTQAPAASSSVTVRREKTTGEIYRHDFRRWHVKVLLIIILLLGSTYLIALNFPWMFHLIN